MWADSQDSIPPAPQEKVLYLWDPTTQKEVQLLTGLLGTGDSTHLTWAFSLVLDIS